MTRCTVWRYGFIIDVELDRDHRALVAVDEGQKVLQPIGSRCDSVAVAKRALSARIRPTPCAAPVTSQSGGSSARPAFTEYSESADRIRSELRVLRLY